MAALFISEFGISNNGLPSLPARATQDLTIGSSASTANLGAGSQVVGLQADVGCRVIVGSSSSTGVPTSTSGVRIGAGLPMQYFNVAPLSRLVAIST